MFSGPWQWTFDASVKKAIVIREGKTLDLHFSMFNVFNHPTFYLNPSDGGDYGVDRALHGQQHDLRAVHEYERQSQSDSDRRVPAVLSLQRGAPIAVIIDRTAKVARVFTDAQFPGTRGDSAAAGKGGPLILFSAAPSAWPDFCASRWNGPWTAKAIS